MRDQPLTYRCGLQIPNRLALAPLTNTQSAPDGTLLDAEARWLVARAAGGWGLVSTCAAFISTEGNAWRGQLGIASESHLAGLTSLAAAIQEAGGVGIVQLHHGGARAVQAPDRISADASRGVRAATEADLERVIGEFAAAAARAERAGFSGVEIHGANGYLLTQFFAPGANHRTDRWGDSLSGRALLTREVTRAVRAATSPGFLVGVRISPVDLYARYNLVLEESLQLGQWLAQDGADFVHLSLARATGTAPASTGGESIAAAFRRVLPSDCRLHVAGGVWTAADVDRALGLGADVVVCGRAGIAHPDLPRRLRMPGFEPQRPPWTRAQLVDAAVGEAFIQYLSMMSGMVVGGRPAR